MFDVDTAIETATEMFWRNGYERTSLADLTTAMGITPPSFYFEFGSKEGLFKRVLKHYSETRLKRVEEAFNQPTTRDLAEHFLFCLADLYTETDRPPGCLVVTCSLPSADDDRPVRGELVRIRDARGERLRSRFQDAITGGDLPRDADPDALAHFLMCVAWGMAVDAQGGATRADLQRTAALALKAWPN
ncbi:MAG: TetR/AcrR family transcriptional regulator [Bradyrhizobium sp.]|nr:TetR/AcrR family transcriptional regulator [Bradyrhizobium sp.]